MRGRRKEELATYPTLETNRLLAIAARVKHPFPTGRPRRTKRRSSNSEESSPHRLYLAHCWIVSLRQKLATVRERFSQGYHEWIIELVEANCEIEKYSGGEALGGRQARNVDCRTICEPILRANNCYCLCCCARHREECPVHRLS